VLHTEEAHSGGPWRVVIPLDVRVSRFGGDSHSAQKYPHKGNRWAVSRWAVSDWNELLGLLRCLEWEPPSPRGSERKGLGTRRLNPHLLQNRKTRDAARAKSMRGAMDVRCAAAG
jgi:hypothetical protein